MEIDGTFNGHDVTGGYDQSDYGPSYGFGKCDPLFYHKRIDEVVLRNSSKKAYKLAVTFENTRTRVKETRVLWVPKAICREVKFDSTNKGSLYVHRGIFNKIVLKWEKEVRDE